MSLRGRSRRAPKFLPVIHHLEARQLLSFDPTSLVASGATNAAIANLSHSNPNVSPPTTFHPQPTQSGIRPY